MKRILDGQKQNMVGPRIKQLRLEKGMTQKTLAERLETLAVYVCRGSISRIEEQKRTITDIELVNWQASQRYCRWTYPNSSKKTNERTSQIGTPAHSI